MLTFVIPIMHVFTFYHLSFDFLNLVSVNLHLAMEPFVTSLFDKIPKCALSIVKNR